MEVVHDHIRAGLDLRDAGVARGPLPRGDTAGRADLAWNTVLGKQLGDAGEELHRLALPFMAQVVVECQRAMPLVAGDSLEAQRGKVHHLPGNGQGIRCGIDSAAVHAGVHLNEDPER